MNLPARPAALLAALGLALALPAAAQQTPITGHMMDGRAPATTPAPAPMPAPAPAAPAPLPATAAADPAPQALPPPPAPAEAVAPMSADAGDIGSVTRQLLRLQADGSQAGHALPMLGDEATASYRRYLQSFNHPIPEFFETTVGKNGSNGNGR